MPWHELKALAREEVEVTELKKSKMKKQRRNLLGRLSTDLDYLEGLLNEVNIGQPQPVVDEQDELEPTPDEPDEVSKQTLEAITFLKERQEFWSQFKPMYSK